MEPNALNARNNRRDYSEVNNDVYEMCKFKYVVAAYIWILVI